MSRAGRLVAFVVFPSLLAGLALLPAEAQEQRGATAGLSLSDLEQMALARNPTMAQAQAAVRAAQGRRQQVGRYPNPLVGYELDDLAARAPDEAKHFFWFQVPIVIGGKLGHAQTLADVDRQRAGALVEVQRLRVLTSLRMLFYEALGAARLLALREELAGLTREAVDVSEELYNVGQADQPDVLEVEIEAERSALEVERAREHQARVWRLLAAVAGNPTLPIMPLVGDPEPAPPTVPLDVATARLLAESPVVAIARTNVERARAGLERVRAERVPNMFVRSKLGYSGERINGGRSGFEAGVEIGVPLPLFDRQQGNLAAAEADVEHATREVERVELELRSQVATVVREQSDAAARVQRYRREILPRAQKAVELYERGFQQMSAAYTQVLIARRSLYQARAEHLQALVDAWRAAALLDGLLLAGGLEAPAHTNVQAPPPSGHLPTASERAAD
jgi:cobalt-zinc-cadmium efflux system outer membrane protein